MWHLQIALNILTDILSSWQDDEYAMIIQSVKFHDMVFYLHKKFEFEILESEKFISFV